jgi:regulator of protease activity HflC (stomatin/prohibitin superfamily)
VAIGWLAVAAAAPKVGDRPGQVIAVFGGGSKKEGATMFVPELAGVSTYSGRGRSNTAAVGCLVFVVAELILALPVILLALYHPVAGVLGAVLAFLIGILAAAGVRVANQWEKIAVLRLGNFRGMRGPGFFWIVPVIDTTPYTVDIRLVTYDVPKQKSLSKDNIPVTVDAIVYYRVDNAEMAVLKVENFRAATQLGAQTILRDLIGKSHLDELLSERERLSETMQKSLDELTDEWGIKVPNVEVKEVIISEALEDAIAREPAAEREKRARLKLAEAEKLAAKTILEAAQIYEKDEVALQLRSMNMLYEMCMEGKATVVFVPTESHLGMPAPIGVYGITEKLKSLQLGGQPAEEQSEA